MKILLLILATLIMTSSLPLFRAPRQSIPREFQSLNIEQYLKNSRAVAFQLKCIIYDGFCDRIGQYLKVLIPELLKNGCKTCDKSAKQKATTIVQFLQREYPQEWSDAIRKFKGKDDNFEKAEAELGVKLAPVPVPNGPRGPPDLSKLAAELSKLGTDAVQSIPKENRTAIIESALKHRTTEAPSSTMKPVEITSPAPQITTSIYSTPIPSNLFIPARTTSTPEPFRPRVTTERFLTRVKASSMTTTHPPPATTKTTTMEPFIPPKYMSSTMRYKMPPVTTTLEPAPTLIIPVNIPPTMRSIKTTPPTSATSLWTSPPRTPAPPKYNNLPTSTTFTPWLWPDSESPQLTTRTTKTPPNKNHWIQSQIKEGEIDPKGSNQPAIELILTAPDHTSTKVRLNLKVCNLREL